ncbi:MAG: HAD family hydrolase [Acidimicrobiales bacterium]
MTGSHDADAEVGRSATTPAAVIFDFDGTMVDTEWPVFESIRGAYRAHGLDFAVEDWVDNIGRADHAPWEEELAAALGDQPAGRVLAEARRREKEAIAGAGIRPGVTELIDSASAAGVPLAVASSSPSSWVEDHLRRLGLRARFEVVRTRDHVARAKPWPDVFVAAASALGIDPADALVIEDSRHGCAAAKAAAMTCVVVPNRITRFDPPTGADLVIDSLLELPYARFGLPDPRPCVDDRGG